MRALKSERTRFTDSFRANDDTIDGKVQDVKNYGRNSRSDIFAALNWLCWEQIGRIRFYS